MEYLNNHNQNLLFALVTGTKIFVLDLRASIFVILNFVYLLLYAPAPMVDASSLVSSGRHGT